MILTGGGARAAYQAGVLAAIADLLRAEGRAPAHPFQILCGNSAGAINIAALASAREGFAQGAAHLERIWEAFRSDQVFVADTLGLSASAGRWLSALTLGWLTGSTPKAFLDTSPLRRLLQRELHLETIDTHIAAGRLHAVAVGASSYSTGEQLTFYSAGARVAQWQRAQRRAVRTLITTEHLLASSAIPILFPPVLIKVGSAYHWLGDGAMRQVAPMSPAIHLGARAILVVSTGIGSRGSPLSNKYQSHPSLAQVGGHALSGIFLDTIAFDVELLHRTNAAIANLSSAQREALGLRQVALLQIHPSEPIETIAVRHRMQLPWMLATLFGRVGVTESRGAAMLSYLLFEARFTRELIALGRKDALAQAPAILQFIGQHSAPGSEPHSGPHSGPHSAPHSAPGLGPHSGPHSGPQAVSA
ncbi:MAG: patatin-like phospholipase family protein [Betaproteobacteria bacterium]|nr:patatin-like phospholipase family protein [Betaproteobacteria bacterium]